MTTQAVSISAGAVAGQKVVPPEDRRLKPSLNRRIDELSLGATEEACEALGGRGWRQSNVDFLATRHHGRARYEVLWQRNAGRPLPSPEVNQPVGVMLD